jgi:hypothetical protein
MYSIQWEMTKSHIIESQEIRQNLEHRGIDRRISEFEYNAQWIQSISRVQPDETKNYE